MLHRISYFFLCFSLLNFYNSQDLILGDYISGNGIVLASTDNNYKVVLRGYSQSLFESRTLILILASFSSIDKYGVTVMSFTSSGNFL